MHQVGLSPHTYRQRVIAHPDLPWSRLFKPSGVLLTPFNTFNTELAHTQTTHTCAPAQTTRGYACACDRVALSRAYVCLGVHACAWVCLCVHVCACVCMCVHAHTYSCTHAHMRNPLRGGSVIHDIPCSAGTPTIYGMKPCGRSAPRKLDHVGQKTKKGR